MRIYVLISCIIVATVATPLDNKIVKLDTSQEDTSLAPLIKVT